MFFLFFSFLKRMNAIIDRSKIGQPPCTLLGNFTSFNSLGMWEWKGGHLKKTDLQKTEKYLQVIRKKRYHIV